MWEDLGEELKSVILKAKIALLQLIVYVFKYDHNDNNNNINSDRDCLW